MQLLAGFWTLILQLSCSPQEAIKQQLIYTEFDYGKSQYFRREGITISSW